MVLGKIRSSGYDVGNLVERQWIIGAGLFNFFSAIFLQDFGDLMRQTSAYDTARAR